MATNTKPAAKPGAAKTAKAAAAPASTVATPAKDEAADMAALSNQGSGDSNGSAAGAGEQGAPGEGATPGAAPNTGGSDSAAGTPQEGAPGDNSNTAAHGGEALAAAADSARKDDGEAAVLSRTLVNQTAYTQRLPRLGVVIGPGESLIVGFRDAGHQEKCEQEIEQIRELNGWTEDSGLHWGRDE